MAQNIVPDFMKKNAPTASNEQAKAPAAEEPKAPAAEEAKAPAAPAAEETKEKKTRKAKAKEMTPEDIDFVLQNVSKMSYTDMAEARGLTKFQVNRVLMDTKKRLRSQYPEGTPEREQIEKYISDNLSRPEDSKPGAGGSGRGSKVKEALDNTASDILKHIFG